MEEFSPDLLSVLLPTVLGVAMVLATVAIVFWIGSGKQQSYEEARAQASRKADEALKEKEQVSPRSKKPRKAFRKKKGEEEAESVPHPRKGILKTPSTEGTVQAVPERAPPNKVEFKLDNSGKDEEVVKDRHSTPPTPYPKNIAQVPLGPRIPQPLFEEPEPEEPSKTETFPESAPLPTGPEPVLVEDYKPPKQVAVPRGTHITAPSKETETKKKPAAAASTATTTAPAGGSVGAPKKTRNKTKQAAVSSGEASLPPPPPQL